LVDAFARRRVGGLILTTISSDHAYLQSERHGTPIVFIDRPPTDVPGNTVLTNNYEAAYLATDHLIRQDHRRILHLGDELSIATARERRRGFCDAMNAAGLLIIRGSGEIRPPNG